MKNPIDPNGNQTCDVLACSAVPQLTAPLHTPRIHCKFINSHPFSSFCFTAACSAVSSLSHTLTYKGIWYKNAYKCKVSASHSFLTVCWNTKLIHISLICCEFFNVNMYVCQYHSIVSTEPTRPTIHMQQSSVRKWQTVVSRWNKDPVFRNYFISP